MNVFISSFRPVASATMLAVLLLAGCGERAAPTAQAEPPAPSVQGNQIRFSPDHPQLKLLAVVPATSGRSVRVDLPARLVWNEERTQRMFAPFAGRVTEIKADVGQRVKAAPARRLPTSFSLASICTHSEVGSVTTNSACVPAPDWSGRSSWPGLMLRSTTTPLMPERRPKRWFTPEPPAYIAVRALAREASACERALSASACSRSLRAMMPASNSSRWRRSACCARLWSTLALAVSAWACPKSGEARVASGLPALTDCPRSARMLLTRPANGG